VPIHLADSLLFGHLKGALTGADRTRTGLVETAEAGTIFLDNIEACDPAVQAKLLRLGGRQKLHSGRWYRRKEA
jgi:DNA-binding NtrC family response regulator